MNVPFNFIVFSWRNDQTLGFDSNILRIFLFLFCFYSILDYWSFFPMFHGFYSVLLCLIFLILYRPWNHEFDSKWVNTSALVSVGITFIRLNGISFIMALIPSWYIFQWLFVICLVLIDNIFYVTVFPLTLTPKFFVFYSFSYFSPPLLFGIIFQWSVLTSGICCFLCCR